MSDNSSNRTVPGIGPGGWDSGALAREQEQQADTTPIAYRVYTEDVDRTVFYQTIVRYFNGATVQFGIGIWQGDTEASVVVEILATRADLQTVVHLVGDIRHAFGQSCVILTWHPISRLDVTK